MPEPIIEKQSLKERQPDVAIWNERTTKEFQEALRIGRTNVFSAYEDIWMKATCCMEVMETAKQTTQGQQITGLLEQARNIQAGYLARAQDVIQKREQAGIDLQKRIEDTKEKIFTLQADETIALKDRQWKIKQLLLELESLVNENPISIEQKDEARGVVDKARDAVELKAEEQPVIRGVQTILKYAESGNLLPERNEELEAWKERNLMDIQQLKRLYGGAFPGELPAHLGWLLMNIDTRLEEVRSKVGLPQEFQFAIKRYSTLVKHFEELVGEIADRVEQDLPGAMDQVAALISEKSRLRKAVAGASEQHQKEAATRIEQINQKIEELQDQIKERVRVHMAQMPPPEAEMMPHTKEQWGPYASEQEARTAILALLQAPLPDTIWLEELGEVKALVEFYRMREKDVPEALKLRIQNKIRYFQLKFDMIKEKLVTEEVLNPEGLAPSQQAPEPTPEPSSKPTPAPVAQMTSNTQVMDDLESLQIDTTVPEVQNETVYAHRPTGERFIYNEATNELILPTPQQMTVIEERMRERLSDEDIANPDRVERAMEELIKRKKEEVQFMANLLKRGSLPLAQEILNMPFTDFMNDDWFRSEIAAYIKQEGEGTKRSAAKARKFILAYLDQSKYDTKDNSLQVGEVLRRAIDFKFSQ